MLMAPIRMILQTARPDIRFRCDDGNEQKQILTPFAYDATGFRMTTWGAQARVPVPRAIGKNACAAKGSEDFLA